MDLTFLVQNLVDGLSRGALYGVYAMGFTLIFGVLDILNLAHAATFMWCAFVGWLIMAAGGMPLPVGLVAAMIAGVKPPASSGSRVILANGDYVVGELKAVTAEKADIAAGAVNRRPCGFDPRNR